MPSPVGHSFIGLAVILARILPRGTSWKGMWPVVRSAWAPVLCFLFLANAQDIDYIPGIAVGKFNEFHHYYTHSLIWSVLLAIGVWLCWKAFKKDVGRRELTFLLVLSLSHLLADYLTEDGSLPYGVMAWWPVDDTYYLSGLPIFLRLEKANYSDMLCWHNVRVVLREAALTMPLVLGVLLWKLRCGTTLLESDRPDPML